MNIRDHIIANHYPFNDRGLALVPMRNGLVATICWMNGPEGEELIGWQGDARQYVTTWTAEGPYSTAHGEPLDLLPPPPRKVEVKAYALVANNATYGELSWKPENLTTAEKDRFQIVELTGSYEEEWK